MIFKSRLTVQAAAPILALLAACVLTAVVSGQSAPAVLPAQLESYVSKVVKPTAAQRKAIFVALR